MTLLILAVIQFALLCAALVIAVVQIGIQKRYHRSQVAINANLDQRLKVVEARERLAGR